MTMPPMLLHLYVASPERTPIRLWLPLFLLWPLVILLIVLPLLLAVLVDVVLWLTGQRYHHYSLLIVRVLGLLGETRGMVVRVRNKEATVDVTVA